LGQLELEIDRVLVSRGTGRGKEGSSTVQSTQCHEFDAHTSEFQNRRRAAVVERKQRATLNAVAAERSLFVAPQP
jgi:hypothetical protein